MLSTVTATGKETDAHCGQHPPGTLPSTTPFLQCSAAVVHRLFLLLVVPR